MNKVRRNVEMAACLSAKAPVSETQCLYLLVAGSMKIEHDGK